MAAKKIEKIEKFMNLEEASAFLGGMSVNAIRKKIREGLLPAYKPGRSVLVLEEDLITLARRFKQ